MEKEMLTIIMPVRNRAGILRPTLDSLANQTLRPLRIVAVDNGSTDSTPVLLKKWAEEAETDDLRIDIVSEPQTGACAARNRGLREVTSPLVSFFDSDDIAYPEYASSICKGFETSEGANLLVWRKSVRDNGSNRVLPSHFRDLLKGQILHAAIATSCFAVKTDFLNKVGGWSANNIPCWQDWELGIRMLLARPEIAMLNRPLADVCPRAESITGSQASERAGEWELAAADVLRLDAKGDEERVRCLVCLRLMALAGRYRYEGAEAEARKLKENVLKSVSSKMFRLRLRSLFEAASRGIPGALTLFSAGV